MGERARIVLACLQGKEIQQVAREIGTSIPTVSKWRRRFAQNGMSGLRDRARRGGQLCAMRADLVGERHASRCYPARVSAPNRNV